MIIGFSCGNFYRIFPQASSDFLIEDVDRWKKNSGNAIEIHCSNEKLIEVFLNSDIDLSFFKFISIHAPEISKKEKNSDRMLLKFNLLKEKYKIDNFVFHVDKSTNWDLINKYNYLPISIENMDSNKNDGRTVDEIEKILSKYDFGLTLDLQHCYTNDKSMKVARDFQEKFDKRIVEYHISGFEPEFVHYPLFKTKQDEIISALLRKDVPIIIESTFDTVDDAEEELQYIKRRLVNKNGKNNFSTERIVDIF